MPYKRLPGSPGSLPEQPYMLRIAGDHGDESLVDVSRLISTYRVYTPLRHAAHLFRQVRVGEYGTDVVWTNDLDMSLRIRSAPSAGAIRGDNERGRVSRLASA